MNQKIIVVVAALVLIGGYLVFSGEGTESASQTNVAESSPIAIEGAETAQSEPAPTPMEDQAVVASNVAPSAAEPESAPAHPEYTDDGYPWNEELRPLNPNKPGYPISARRNEVEGDVVASFLVNTDGSTSNCEIVSATDLSGEAINDFNRSVCITIEGYQYPEITEAKTTKIKFHYRLDEVE